MPASLSFDNIIGSFPQVAGQIHDGHTVGGNMEGHYYELPVQPWDQFALNLDCGSGCRDDVLGSSMIIIPLSLSGLPHLLGSSDDMDCCRVSFHDATVVMNDVGPGS